MKFEMQILRFYLVGQWKWSVPNIFIGYHIVHNREEHDKRFAYVCVIGIFFKMSINIRTHR